MTAQYAVIARLESAPWEGGFNASLLASCQLSRLSVGILYTFAQPKKQHPI
jgi:hypothetical protein